MEQTLYESKNVAVEGFPQAVLVDQTYFKSVAAAYADQLAAEDHKSLDNSYWQLTRVPGQCDCATFGLTQEEVDTATAQRSNFNASRNPVSCWLNDAIQPLAAELRGQWPQVLRRDLSPAAQGDQEDGQGSDRHVDRCRC